MVISKENCNFDYKNTYISVNHRVCLVQPCSRSQLVQSSEQLKLARIQWVHGNLQQQNKLRYYLIQTDRSQILFNTCIAYNGSWVSGMSRGFHLWHCQHLDSIMLHGWKIHDIQPWAPMPREPGTHHPDKSVKKPCSKRARRLANHCNEDSKCWQIQGKMHLHKASAHWLH